MQSVYENAMHLHFCFYFLLMEWVARVQLYMQAPHNNNNLKYDFGGGKDAVRTFIRNYFMSLAGFLLHYFMSLAGTTATH